MKSSPAIAGGKLFVGTDAGKVFAIDIKTANPADPKTRPVLWTFSAEDAVDSSPEVVKGVVWVGSNDGNVYAIDAQTGAKAGQYRTGGPVLSSPVAVDDGVAVGSSDDSIYAFAGSGV